MNRVHPATEMAADEYVIDGIPPNDRLQVGMRFAARGQEYRIIGAPVYASFQGATARVRVVGGPRDGAEFTAHLRHH